MSTAWPCVQHLSLAVRDVARSHDFYRDFLGFTSAMRHPDIAELRMGETKLVLLRGEGVTASLEMHFGFREDTRRAVDDWGRKAQAAKLKIDFGPAVAEWRGYVLYFRDPDGYQIEIWSDE